MALNRFIDLPGSFEAAWDGYRVILREKGKRSPNFHLTRSLVDELLGLFSPASKPPEALPSGVTLAGLEKAGVE